MVILLASYPRSGNTFTRIVLKQIFGVDTWSQYDDKIFAEGPLQNLVGQKNLAGKKLETALKQVPATQLVVCKTHNRRPSLPYKAVYVVRDVRDVIVSLKHWFDYPDTPETIETNWQRAIKGGPHGNWTRHVRAWLKYHRLLSILHYEDLLQDPIGTVQQAFGDYLPPPRGDTLPSFQDLHAQRKNFFREGKTGEWKKHLPSHLLPLVEELHGPTLRHLGYS